MSRKLIYLIFLGFISISTLHSALTCTIFSISHGDKVYFGNNEDWSNPETYIWFKPSTSQQYGGVYLGFDDFFPQGGMNEKGLCYDGNALASGVLNAHPELPTLSKWVGIHIIETCVNISETIKTALSYNWGVSMKYQIHYADATGDAVVVAPGLDKELSFTKKKNNSYLVSTNFNVNHTDYSYYCQRYETASNMLADLESEENLTIDAVRNVLAATHQLGTYATKYSNIFDPVNLKIYLWYNHDFTTLIELDLLEELTLGPHQYKLSELFTKGTSQGINTSENHSSTSSTNGFTVFILILVCISLKSYKRKN
jgi:hypothetical protein